MRCFVLTVIVVIVVVHELIPRLDKHHDSLVRSRELVRLVALGLDVEPVAVDAAQLGATLTLQRLRRGRSRGRSSG